MVDSNGNVSIPGFMRATARTFCLWVANELANGRTVELYGAGVIHATFRKGRKAPFGSFSKDTFVLKFTSSTSLKAKLRELAKNTEVSYFGLEPASKMKPLNKAQLLKVHRLARARKADSTLSDDDSDSSHPPSIEPQQTSS